MKKTSAIAGILALTITPTVSFADHLEPKQSEIKVGGDLLHTNLKESNLVGANLAEANLSNANLFKINLTSADLSNAKEER